MWPPSDRLTQRWVSSTMLAISRRNAHGGMRQLKRWIRLGSNGLSPLRCSRSHLPSLPGLGTQ